MPFAFRVERLLRTGLSESLSSEELALVDESSSDARTVEVRRGEGLDGPCVLGSTCRLSGVEDRGCTAFAKSVGTMESPRATEFEETPRSLELSLGPVNDEGGLDCSSIGLLSSDERGVGIREGLSGRSLSSGKLDVLLRAACLKAPTVTV